MVPSKNHTLFQTNMGKVYTRLQTKIAQNPYSLGAAHTVEPRCNEGPRDWKYLFAITRFRYIEVLFHIFSYYWGKENRSLYRGLRYIEVRYIEVPLYLYGFYKGVHSSPPPPPPPSPPLPGTGTQRNFCLFHFGEKKAWPFLLH